MDPDRGIARSCARALVHTRTTPVPPSCHRRATLCNTLVPPLYHPRATPLSPSSRPLAASVPFLRGRMVHRPSACHFACLPRDLTHVPSTKPPAYVPWIITSLRSANGHVFRKEHTTKKKPKKTPSLPPTTHPHQRLWRSRRPSWMGRACTSHALMHRH